MTDLPLPLSPPSTLRVHVSASADERLSIARDTLRGSAPGCPVIVVGATRGAADDLARAVSALLPATFGLHRCSLIQLAARIAAAALAGDGSSSSTWLGAEAVAARAVFEARQEGNLEYFAPVATTPGFPRALARTLYEARLAGVGAGSMVSLAPAGPDLARLLERFGAGFDAAASVDRAGLYHAAAPLVGQFLVADLIVLLDVPIDNAAEATFIEALATHARAVLATVPRGDEGTIGRFATMGADIERHHAPGAGDLASLRRYLFDTGTEPPVRTPDDSVEFFSAPGEGREAVEITRRILREAERGVRFDEMAILVRTPQSYFGLLEHALRRADIPVWFDSGTRRPHPAGRAFLALLACAAERLSAARFAEYLSLGQVPPVARVAAADSGEGSWVPSQDEAFGLPDAVRGEPLDDVSTEQEDDAVAGGTLRAPWRWEKLLVDAAVIGQDASRWKRRLAGLAAELELQKQEAARQHGADSGRVVAFERTSEQLEHLRAFAIPVVEELAAWPRAATWGDWLDRLAALAPRVLRTSSHVLRVLADLRPMASVGPIDLDEARRVLTDRLLTLESDPPARRFGRVFVGTPQQARGRAFRVVFVPGLAERMFPQKPREDPIMLDSLRREADASLRTQMDRLAAERLLLALACGAASERLFVSYPRIELTESPRARVPSFYALDVMRAVTGRVPDYEWLEDRARVTGNATLAWPAPPDPAEAIDDLEHDLAYVRTLLDERDRNAVKGRAHYLLKLNECLRRSVIDRWGRGEARWSPGDGLTRVSKGAVPALQRQRLTARPYSVSALQRFSACPYQFLLASIHRLEPLERPEPLQHMDPLTRGSLFHEIQAQFLRHLADSDALPVSAANVDGARRTLDSVINRVASARHDELAPAVERVWADEIASIRRDLHGWLHYLERDGAEWTPRYFELAFGSVPGERDASSIRDDITLEGGFLLRGAVDLVEQHRASGVFRVTDHKTGRRPERMDQLIVGGGAVLQPALYGVAVEAALHARVSQGRLFYCTATGGYGEHEIPLNDRTRAAGMEVLQIIDRAIDHGFLAAAPTEHACGWCDFRPVCGPDVYRRVLRKPGDRIADLTELRSRA